MPRTKKSNPETTTKSKSTTRRQDTDHVLIAWRWLRTSSFGHLLLTVFAIFLIILVDILITGNSLQAFLLLFGIEFLLVNIFISLVVVLRQRARARREAQQQE